MPTNKALIAWGSSKPRWIESLALECDAWGVRATARKLGVSPATVSIAINRRRDPEKLIWIKELVEATLMVSIVACPVRGVMGKEECLQEQARPFFHANPLRVQLYRACRSGCPHYKEQKQ